MSERMTSKELAAIRRRAIDAATRFRTAVGWLRWQAEKAPTESVRWVAAYQAKVLLDDVLGAAADLVEVLDRLEADDSAIVDGELEAQARALFESLRARRLAAKLEQVEGRTPAEADAFREKAAELRGVRG